MSDHGSDKTRKYRIVPIAGGWRVEHDGMSIGLFAEPALAVACACQAAKTDAARGRLAIVTAETEPQELHCYSPSVKTAALDRGQPAYPRLIASR